MQLFREGRALVVAGDLEAACERFERSEKLDAKVGTLLNLADCQERRVKLATAWAWFIKAKELAARNGDAVRAAEANRRAVALEPRLSYLTLNTSSVEGIVIRRDGVVVDPAAWNVAVPVDAGTYLLEATAVGHRAWLQRARVDEGQRLVVQLALAPDPDAVDDGARPSPGGLPFRSLGVGVLGGANHRERFLVGARVIGTLPIPGGALRGNGSVIYSRYDDNIANDGEPKQEVKVDTIYLGVGFDYVFSPIPQVAVAAGLGIGLELDVEPDGVGTGGALALRGSPVIVRLAGGQIEAGLHLIAAFAGTEFTLHALAGLDWFL